MAGSALGILGGTFDPIHNGHLELARELVAALPLSAVRLVPAGDPPHRPPPVASAVDRLAMTELAIAGHAGLEVDAREIVRAGRSYTVLTLEELRAEAPMRPLALIVGADALPRITRLASVARTVRARARHRRRPPGDDARSHSRSVAASGLGAPPDRRCRGAGRSRCRRHRRPAGDAARHFRDVDPQRARPGGRRHRLRAPFASACRFGLY